MLLPGLAWLLLAGGLTAFMHCLACAVVVYSTRVGVDNIRVWEETTLAAANKLEKEMRKFDEQVGQGVCVSGEGSSGWGLARLEVKGWVHVQYPASYPAVSANAQGSVQSEYVLFVVCQPGRRQRAACC